MDIFSQIQSCPADHPEQLFGPSGPTLVDTRDAIKKTYRAMARQVHPDLSSAPDQKKVCEAAFIKLTSLYEETEKLINEGRYGQVRALFSFISKGVNYDVVKHWGSENQLEVYATSWQVNGQEKHGFLRLSKSPVCNRYVRQEAQNVQLLRRNIGPKFEGYIPQLVQSVILPRGKDEKLNANLVYTPNDTQPFQYYSLLEAKKHYPLGLPPRDVAWIYRRLLAGLGYIHSAGLLHFGLFPGNLIIHPQKHGLIFLTLGQCIKLGQEASEIDPLFIQWYPKEVTSGKPLFQDCDLFMASKLAIYLLGGDPAKNQIPATVPKPIVSFLQGCLADLGSTSRPVNAWLLLVEFDELLSRLWGPKSFHKFELPTKK